MRVQVETVHGPDLLAWIPQLAALRIRVFAEFPYCYDGDLDYEESYLKTYAQAQDAVFVLAREGQNIVGVATAVAMREAQTEVQSAVSKYGLDPTRLYYFGESVLLPEFRGQGIGKQFMQQRIAWAQLRSVYESVLFCAVVQPQDHPDRPAQYRGLEGFWSACGFRAVPNLVCKMSWKEHRSKEAFDHQLQFWKKDLIH